MDDIYEHIWDFLNQRAPTTIPERLIHNRSRLTFRDVFEHFKNSADTKIINLRSFGDADKAYLVSKGISKKYLVRNLKKTITGAYLDPLYFQLTALRKKTVYALCPFTGKLVKSHHSLIANINVIFYRFEGNHVFYVIAAGLNGFKKSALYIPREELIVTAGNLWSFEEHDLFELKARVVCHFRSCHRYFSNYEPSRKTAVCIGFYHFAHHLWNELSGVDRLRKRKLLDRVDRFLVMREPLGKIEEIFPEVPRDKIERKNSNEAIFEDIVSNDLFVVRVGDDFITRELAKRVYRVAKASCLPATLDSVRRARKKHSPLLWIGIRVGSRMWTNQVDGLSKLINSLHSEFPRLGIVFDGFSLPADRSDESCDNQEYADILSQENGVVDDIIARLYRHPRGVPGIFNIIGDSISDANVWAHAIDVYVSPYGTLQHKVGWLTNKPGIVHSNQKLLENPPRYIWTAVENAIRPHYVRRVAVADVLNIQEKGTIYRQVSDLNEIGAGIQAAIKRVQADPEFNNYELCWMTLNKDVLNLLHSSKATIRLDWWMLMNNLKRKAKNILQGLTRSLDTSKI